MTAGGKGMKRFYIAGAVIGVLLLFIFIPLGIWYSETYDSAQLLKKEWDNIHDASIMWHKGEIVHVAQHDNDFIVYLDPAGTGNVDYLIEFLVDQDTELYGEIDGMKLDDMIKELKPGAFVKVNYYNKETDMLVSGHKIYVAYAVSVIEEVDND